MGLLHDLIWGSYKAGGGGGGSGDGTISISSGEPPK